MKQLGVGIVGTGMAFERLHLPAYQSLTEQYRIVALCDDEPRKAKSWAQKLGIPEENVTDDPVQLASRPDVDVIDIMVPIELNYKVTEQVAQAIAGSNKGIICEKPLAATEKEAEAARKLPTKYDIPILIAENYRYNEEINLIHQFINEGRIGQVYFFTQLRVMDMPHEMTQDKFAATEWRQHPEFPGGIILDTGVHDVAALQYLFGKIKEVHSFGVPTDEDFAPYAVLQSNIKFTSGMTGQFTFFCVGKEMQRPLVGLRIFGSNGMIYLEERDCGTINIAYNDGTSEQIPYTPQTGYKQELLNFYNHMVHGEPLASPPEIEFGDTQAMLAMIRSAKEGRAIVVDRPRQPALV